jgi:riboflavin kinase/FMN adenylyltransferase
VTILENIEELSSLHGPIFLAIGVFDGVHLGHRAVIERALSDARNCHGTAVVVTFDPHPARVLRPGQAPRLLTSTPHKIRLLRQLGVPHLLVIKFDAAFAATTAEDFIQSLHRACSKLREICVGHQWSFGHARQGNLKLLEQLGNKLGFHEVGVQAVEIDGAIASSTLVRSAVEKGDLETAARFLGRPFSILGSVVHGDHVGKKLGFPTANLAAHNEQFPPDGVYAVQALLRGERLGGIVNIGVRPTFHPETAARILELHLLDFSDDVYGEEIEVIFQKFLRPEIKFGGGDELRAQIVQDITAARAVLADGDASAL